MLYFLSFIDILIFFRFLPLGKMPEGFCINPKWFVLLWLFRSSSNSRAKRRILRGFAPNKFVCETRIAPGFAICFEETNENPLRGFWLTKKIWLLIISKINSFDWIWFFAFGKKCRRDEYDFKNKLIAKLKASLDFNF